MAEIHKATDGKLTRELTEDVRQFVADHIENAVRQAANDYVQADTAARMALYDVNEDIVDHLGIKLAATLATFGISPDGVAAWRMRTPEETLRESYRTGGFPCGQCGGSGWDA
jgi:hypothetical protein